MYNAHNSYFKIKVRKQNYVFFYMTYSVKFRVKYFGNVKYISLKLVSVKLDVFFFRRE